jgi:hypothetical protein
MKRKSCKKCGKKFETDLEMPKSSLFYELCDECWEKVGEKD